MGMLLEKLTEYGKSDFYPYHMPGHKRNVAGELPREWTSVDITEIEGFDNLHDAQGILKEIQNEAARVFGAEESYYLINGSTCGILSAVSASVSFGGELLIARNCHKSVYHGAYLRRLTLHYIYPETVPGFDICEAVTAEQVREALEKYPGTEAVLIVSPTYEGRIADVEAIAKVVHEKGLPLIVDEAHGAHLGFAPDFADNSNRKGADLVIHSLHKTLPALTQTALLHCNGKLVDREKARRFLHIYQTSSPSYVLMAGMEEAVRIATDGGEKFSEFVQNWKKLLKRLQNCKNMHILPGDYDACAQKQHDIGKLVLGVKRKGLSGQQLYDILLRKYHLQMEMACESYVLAMFTLADTGEGYERLAEAIEMLDEELSRLEVAEGKATELHILVQQEPFWSAWDAEKEKVSLDAAVGCIAGEFINLYPPGTPFAVPGEVLSEQAIQILKQYLAAGLDVQGIDGEQKVSVLRRVK